MIMSGSLPAGSRDRCPLYSMAESGEQAKAAGSAGAVAKIQGQRARVLTRCPAAGHGCCRSRCLPLRFGDIPMIIADILGPTCGDYYPHIIVRPLPYETT